MSERRRPSPGGATKGRILRPEAADAGFTLVEIAVVCALALIVILVIWRVFDFFYGTSGKTGVIRLADKSAIQREARIGLRQLLSRLREATEILDEPGQTTQEVRFRDILNNEVRLRVDPDRKALVSERSENGTFAPETNNPGTAKTDTGEVIRPASPIHIDGCESALFTIVSPTCVIAHLTLASGKMKDTLMLSVHLRNEGLKN